MKKIILIWTHKVINLKTTCDSNFWGLGDMIRGAIYMFQLSKLLHFELIIDIQLHNISNFLKHKPHEYSNFILKNKNNIQFISNPEQYILENKNKELLYFFTNGFYKYPIDNECRQFIQQLLTPNDDFQNYIFKKKKELPFINYNIIHFRLGDELLIKNNNNINSTFTKYILLIKKQMIDNNYILLSDSKEFKKYIKDNVNIFTFDIEIGHIGYEEHKNILRDTLFEFFILLQSTKIISYSIHSWGSGYAQIANKIFNIPLEEIQI
jgi:hypothetical protein